MGCGLKSLHDEEDERIFNKQRQKAEGLGVPLQLGKDIRKILEFFEKEKRALPHGFVVSMGSHLACIKSYAI